VETSEVLLVEAGGPRLPSVEGFREAEALLAEGALDPARAARYAPAGKVFQPVPLPAPGTRGLEAALCYDPNLAQFFRWIVLGDPEPDWREDPDLVTARTVFHDYFTQDWETVARFGPGISRRPGVTVLRRRDDYAQLDRSRLTGLAGIVDTEPANELRAGSETYLEWVTAAGTAFRQVNELIPAGRFLDFATRLDSTRVEPRYQHALVELQRGDLAMAKERLLGALMLDTGHGGLLYNLGTVLEAEGELDGAAIQYAAAILYLDDPTPAHARLGALLVQFGRADEAREHLEAIRRLAPGSEAEQHLEELLGPP
jgi:tetratricopeptide (TPR) repeat protein